MKTGMMPIEKEFSLLKRLPVSMAYEGGSLEAWQENARSQLKTLLGLPYEKAAPDVEIEFIKEHETFRETRFTFESEPGYRVPCHLLKKKKKTNEALPVMICLQGHSTGMHISLGRALYEGDADNMEDGDRDFALQCIRQGICAVTLEQRGFGERGGSPRPNCYGIAMDAILQGRTLIGARVWDIMRLIDVLETDFGGAVDTKRVYCFGNSGGGTATFYAAALETRIVAAMPSCAFCTFADSIGAMYHCACNFVPGIRNYFDMAELAGMIAPRPLVIVSGAEDGIFPLSGAKSEFARVKDIYYANSAAPGNVTHVIGPAGHRFYAEQGWKAFRLLTKDFAPAT